MNIRIKQKTYGPLMVLSSVDEAVVFETEAGYRARGSKVPAPDALSPSDLMLGSLATCIAISMRLAAKELALELGALKVSARAIKAVDLPNRFGRFEVDVWVDPPVDPEKRNALRSRTKSICTVSNTLAAEVELQFQA